MGDAGTVPIEELRHAQLQCDLYLRLLELGHRTELEPFLREALALIVEIGQARQGYIELYDDDGGSTQRWSMAHGLSEEELSGVRAAISRGIIAEALATGEIIVTPSAQLDPRFNQRQSVRLARIEAVLCAPIGEDPPRGVLYLQGQAQSDIFTEAGRTRAATFARHLAPLVDRLLAQRRAAAGRNTTTANLRMTGIIGHSPALQSVLRQLALAAPLDVNVLLTGESGTGKSHFARIIHDNSLRAEHPFVELNCGALPEALVESELFGALPGAHSTATRRITGKVAAAERGTLFLDEIAELAPSAQAKLLQLLQARQYYPLGSATPVVANVRVLAATNRDLKQAVAEKKFRDDLLYRLQVLPIQAPSLTARREDIAELAQHFYQSACARHGFTTCGLSRNAIRAAEAAPWPGNIRQLANAIEAAVIRAVSEGVAQVECAHLFPDDPTLLPQPEESLTLQSATRQFQRRLVGEALDACDWNIPETARRLDITRSHVYNLIRALSIQRAPTKS